MKFTHRINNYVITQRLNDDIHFTENIYRNIFDNTIVAEVLVGDGCIDNPIVPAVFVQLADKTKMLIKHGDLQNYLNRFIYYVPEFTFNPDTYEFN